jgi:hypothetical protein
MKNFIALISVVLALSTSVLAASSFDTTKIEELTGLKGKLNEKKDVFKVSYPRSDLHVKAAGVTLNPAMGLTAWAAFQKMGSHVMVMGDIVMTEEQVNPVMSVALENGLEVTALHNHFLGDTPKIMFMHIGGMGDTAKLGAAVGAVFAKLKETSNGKAKFPEANIDPVNSALNSKKLDEVFGKTGDLKDGVYKFTFGKKTKMKGVEIGSDIGVNTWAAFTGSDTSAVVDGDFAMLESELQGVLKTLRKADIQIVAIHNHMTEESPRIIFLHFWGLGVPETLARGIKSALETQKP